MASKRSRYHHKVDKLRGLLSPQDLIEFNALCQWNPTYASIQGWFALRGHQISLNAVYHWWKANYPDRDEIKFMNALVDHLDIKDGHRLHVSALKLAVMATSILDEHLSGKLASAEPKFLVESQRELFSGTVELAKLSRD